MYNQFQIFNDIYFNPISHFLLFFKNQGKNLICQLQHIKHIILYFSNTIKRQPKTNIHSLFVTLWLQDDFEHFCTLFFQQIL